MWAGLSRGISLETIDSSGVVEAHTGALEAHPIAMEDHLVGVEAHHEAMDALHGGMDSHLQSGWLIMNP